MKRLGSWWTAWLVASMLWAIFIGISCVVVTTDIISRIGKAPVALACEEVQTLTDAEIESWAAVDRTDDETKGDHSERSDPKVAQSKKCLAAKRRDWGPEKREASLHAIFETAAVILSFPVIALVSGAFLGWIWRTFQHQRRV